MSDGSTDIWRDSCRAEAYADFLFLLVIYLEHPIDENLKQVKDAAETCDGIPRGYWQGRTALAKNLDEWLEKLCNNEKKVWLRLLIGSQDVFQPESYKKWDCSLYDKLKSISAYSDKTIIMNDYGYGFSTIRGELQEMIDSWIKNEGMCIRKGDEYALIFDELPRPMVEWLGHSSEKTPFERDRKRS